MIDLNDLPAADMIRVGLADLAGRRESVASYLVQIGSLNMRRCGIEVPVSDEDALEADHRLYALLSREHGNDAHRRYNALLRELVSFERALALRHSRMLIA
ncbi:MAG: hypothetical protein LDL31_03290 [Prosthecobacter sp.]|jgi:hypothetical protein|nr:hypothetical protein [Prosthecobacter sp.]